ncbi:ferritin [Candidatus Electronema sp. JM]|uniref:ferritin n=1 Tax=Candidatus Electronema sp. JM TaxID=3401571 RepID=UPI003AA86A61
MLKTRIAEALNHQINAELYSSCLYLSVESYFHSVSLSGFASWMRVQVQEELLHAMKLYDFIISRSGRALLEAVAKPDADWESPLAAFEQVLRHEEGITAKINELMDIAAAEQDHATKIFLQWFVSEQVEEESAVGEILSKLRLIGKDSSGLFLLDAELGKRVFTPPAQQGA